MNLGIADAADHAAHLARGNLSSYSGKRFAEGKKVIAGSEQMRKAITSSNPVIHTSVLAMLKTV